MGKNNKKNKKTTNPGNKNNKNIQKAPISKDDEERNKKYPFVSVCTPTYNRRPFIDTMIKCFNSQTYPMDRIEWIIIDDGTDKIENLVTHHPNVKYFYYDTKMTLGKKRNLMHEKSCGDILVYMDDDDYYPPERISHAVSKLMNDKEALCAGSSEIYIYFKHIQKMYQFGPYGPKHATAGTFAFKRELLKDNQYDDEACLAEEKAFLKDYTVPFVQLEPLKTILVISHEHNTFDKRKLLDGPSNPMVKESQKTVDMFIKQKDIKTFFMNIDEQLKTYEPGEPIMKPDVLQQMIKIEEKRRKMAEEKLAQLSGGGGQLTATQNGKQIPLTNQQILGLLQTKDAMIKEKDEIIATQKVEIGKLSEQGQITITQDGKEVPLTHEQLVKFITFKESCIQDLKKQVETLTEEVKKAKEEKK